MSGHVHVIGAGLAGLAAALELSAAGRAVTVHEAGPAAGGRCRSYFDRELDLTIDNGNHLLMSGNQAAMRYLDAIGSRAALSGPDRPIFPFIDLTTDERWALRPNSGRRPWWVFSRKRRVPNTRLLDYFVLRRLLRTDEDDETTVYADYRQSELYRPLIEPLTIAILNTRPELAMGRLLGMALSETLLAGGAACRPMFPRAGLSAALIDPAVATLTARGVDFRFSHRIAGLGVTAKRVERLDAPDGPIPIGPADAVVLAVPPWVVADLLPGIMVPTVFETIVNVHFRAVAEPGAAGFIGLLGGTAEWVFVKQDHISTTTSAATRLAESDAERIAALVWPNVRAALGLGGKMPPWRVVKERRATIVATAAQERRRPDAETRMANLVLAGDWTATGLPATIEGAIRSGETAASLLID